MAVTLGGSVANEIQSETVQSRRTIDCLTSFFRIGFTCQFRDGFLPVRGGFLTGAGRFGQIEWPSGKHDQYDDSLHAQVW